MLLPIRLPNGSVNASDDWTDASVPLEAWIALAVFWATTACVAVASARANLHRTQGRDTRDLDDIPGLAAVNWVLAGLCGVLVVGLPVTGHSWRVVVFWVLASVCAAWVCCIVLIKLARRH